MKEIEKSWIEKGYRFFAYEGPRGLKVERLSKEVGKNKSSFYHLFANLDVFLERLLTFHLHQAKIVAEKESNSKNEKELIKVILEHKLDLLFNRQLRIHRENPDFKNCFNLTNQISIPAILPVWKRIIGLLENNSLAQMVLMLSLENFYLQITEETLNETWLEEYFASIRNMVIQLRQEDRKIPLDGSV
jgi:AcrR family transcriptional regulator